MRYLAAALAIALGSCAGSSSPTSTSAPTTTPATTNAPEIEVTEAAGTFAETPEEAVCSGALWAAAEAGSMSPEQASRIAQGEDCAEQLGRDMVAGADELGWEITDLTGWFVLGCLPESTSVVDEDFGPTGEPPLDDETTLALARAGCELPFRVGTDLEVDWEILRLGVCYHFAFTPSPEQVESGLNPCP